MIFPLLLATQLFIDGKEINVTGENPCIPLDVLVNTLGAKVEIRTNQAQQVIEINSPARGAAVKGVLTWLHDIWKPHEPDFGAEVCLAKTEGGGIL